MIILSSIFKFKNRYLGVTKENVIPIYGRGDDQKKDPRESKSGDGVPNRPPGQRPEPQARAPNPGFNANPMQFGNFTFSAGVGYFPSIFGLQFQNFVAPSTATHAGPLTLVEIEQQKLSRLLMLIG